MARPKNAVTINQNSTSKAISNIDQELSKEVADLKSRIGQPGGKKLTVKPTGDFIGPDGANYGPEVQVVVVDFISKNFFYSGPYDANNPSPPDCYAMGRDIELMMPENDSPAKQGDACKLCPMNQFGSGNNGKSKACKNTRELAVLLVDPENPDAHNEPDAPIYSLSIPPTSIKAFDGFVSLVGRTLGAPLKAIVTLLGTNAGTYATISFQNPVANPDYAAHYARRAEIQDQLFRKPDFNRPAAPARNARQQPPRRAAAGGRR